MGFLSRKTKEEESGEADKLAEHEQAPEAVSEPTPPEPEDAEIKVTEKGASSNGASEGDEHPPAADAERGASQGVDADRASSEQSTRAEIDSEDVSRIDADEQDEEETVTTSPAHDWLSEVSEAVEGETMDWPAPAGEDPEWRQGAEDEEPLEEPRVRHLFPVPEESDWEVGELDYDRSHTRVS